MSVNTLQSARQPVSQSASSLVDISQPHKVNSQSVSQSVNQSVSQQDSQSVNKTANPYELGLSQFVCFCTNIGLIKMFTNNVVGLLCNSIKAPLLRNVPD